MTKARYQANPGFTAAEIPRLRLKWAFAYPVGVSNEPAVVGGRVFVSNMGGITFSLDGRTGCTLWAKDLGAPMRTMITLVKLPSGKIAAIATGWFGDVHALDADTGEMLWHSRPNPPKSGEGLPPKPGINALAAGTGKLLWHVPALKVTCSWGIPCIDAHSAAVTAIPGAIFAGSWDGHMRAYSTENGRVLWDFDTGRECKGVNGATASGGTIDHGGQTIADGMLLVNSGGRYGHPGNAMLVFTIDGK